MITSQVSTCFREVEWEYRNFLSEFVFMTYLGALPLNLLFLWNNPSIDFQGEVDIMVGCLPEKGRMAGHMAIVLTWEWLPWRRRTRLFPCGPKRQDQVNGFGSITEKKTFLWAKLAKDGMAWVICYCFRSWTNKKVGWWVRSVVSWGWQKWSLQQLWNEKTLAITKRFTEIPVIQPFIEDDKFWTCRRKIIVARVFAVRWFCSPRCP